jgi:hypothetical protein
MPYDTTPSRTQSENPVIRFFSRPIVGIAGLIAGVVGFGLAAVFYASLPEQQCGTLAAAMHPVRTTVVKMGGASGLSVHLEGQEVKSDVTAVQVALWNDGDLPIRQSDVMEPVKIITPGCRILDASLCKQSRDGVNMRLALDDLVDGKLGVSWEILEPNDGGVIQLIYAGPASAPIELRGVLKGEQNLSKVEYSGMPSGPEDGIQAKSLSVQFLAWVLTIGALILTLLAGLAYRKAKRRHDHQPVSRNLRIALAAVVIALASAVVGLLCFQFWPPPGPFGPPFGF